MYMYAYRGFSGSSVVRNLLASTGDAGDMGLITGLERSPGGGNGNPLQYSYLEPGEPQAMGLQKRGHDPSNRTRTHYI